MKCFFKDHVCDILGQKSVAFLSAMAKITAEYIAEPILFQDTESSGPND
jgi:hypothetical protein